MPKATQGMTYVIQKGDNLSRLANQAYGDPRKWRVIWKTNQTTLRSGDPNLIFPGEIIQIPIDPDLAKVNEEIGLPKADEFLPGKADDEFTLLLDDTEVAIQGGRVIRTMDTVTDGFSASFAWDPADALTELIKPFKYTLAKVYLGGYLILTGRVYVTKTSFSEDGRSATVEGFSSTADIADSSIKPPLEKKKVTLKQRATDVLEPFGLTVTFDADEGDVFDRVTASESETVFDHLADLAKQRSVLISSTIRGDVIFYQAQVGKSVGVVEEEAPPYERLSSEFDGRKRFATNRVIGPTPKKSTGRNALEAVSRDDGVPAARYTTERVEDATPGNIQKIADWRRSRRAAEALEMSFPVSSWYAPDGSLWRENTIVTIKSETLFAPDGFDFIIRSVEYIYDESGTRATLQVVPPQVFTGEPLEEPWR